jgi:hypothetical protein
MSVIEKARRRRGPSAREVVGFSGRSSSERSEVLVLLASLAPADPLMRAAPRNLHSVHK